MKKIDLKKELKHLYLPSAREVSVVDVPKMRFVVADGIIQAGEQVHESVAFEEAIQALYGVAYTLKFQSKQSAIDPIDYTVMALEGLWWVESGQFDLDHTEPWNFTLMIMQPDHITEDMFMTAVDQLQRKKEDLDLTELRLESFHEGLCMQIMHIGPYSEEPRTIQKLEEFALENGCIRRGKHHEIYIGDPRRARPDRLRTVLRHPIERVRPGTDSSS